MSIDISSKNQDRLRATAQVEGVSVDAYVERLMNERDELAAIIQRASTTVTLSPAETRAKIERGFLESERGDVVDGETLAAELLAELDHLEHNRRAG